MRFALVLALLIPLGLAVAGCGGDNLALCNGCSTPTPTPTATSSDVPTPTITTTPF
jgi:hypothetical protein